VLPFPAGPLAGHHGAGTALAVARFDDDRSAEPAPLS
jgi:hypothetical protein